jgi:prepilin-type processing-associated H-X9-DG protein
MKQIGIAFGQYLTDYDGVYPNYDNFKTKIRSQPPEPYANVSSESEWYTVLQPYMPSTSYRPAPENDNVLRCPLDTSLAPADPKNPDRKKEYVSSYSVNGWSEYDLASSAVKSPGTWILMGERNNENCSPNGPWMFYFWTWQGKPRVWPPAATPVPTDKAAKDLVLTRHSERANWLYGDGHVKWVRFPDLWRGGSENPFWPDATP